MLLIFVAVLYRVGNKLNVEETLALAAFSLALLLSDEFRSATRNGIEESIRRSAPSCSTDQLVSGTMSGITQMAKDYVQDKGLINPLTLVRQIVNKVKNTNGSSSDS
ncbi:MAG: hypothetical protein DME55_10160 [Verrucomicrobia bacterium]|nr:MAG: hypothetical protein DME55_10160 [Verrucomicrobiota bacterium]